MAILQRFVATLLIATFVLGNALCLCGAKAAVESPDAGHHAHHASQIETSSLQACPHVDCVGNCATLSSIAANDPAVTTAPRSYELDAPIVAPLIPADQTLTGGSPIYSFVLHAPPALQRTTPVSRFDRLLA